MKNRYGVSRGNGVYQDVSLCLSSHELLRIVSLVIGEIHANSEQLHIAGLIVEIDHNFCLWKKWRESIIYYKGLRVRCTWYNVYRTRSNVYANCIYILYWGDISYEAAAGITTLRGLIILSVRVRSSDDGYFIADLYYIRPCAFNRVWVQVPLKFMSLLGMIVSPCIVTFAARIRTTQTRSIDNFLCTTRLISFSPFVRFPLLRKVALSIYEANTCVYSPKL